MALEKQAEVSGRDHYDAIYNRQLEKEAEWLDRTATQKVDSIERLLTTHRIRCETLLELGCGTGSVILECQRRNLARSYTAVDYSDKAIEFLRGRSQGIEAIAADVTAGELLSHRSFDLVIISHVIEHLEEPLAFLDSIQGIDFAHLIAEVPLDDLPVQRLKAVFKDRTSNLAGHVQFFTSGSFDGLLERAGLILLGKYRYLPDLDPETIRFVCEKNGASPLTYYKMRLIRHLRLASGPLWSAVSHAHYAVLCRKRG